MSASPAHVDLMPHGMHALPLHQATYGTAGARVGELWLKVLSFTLLGYALFGKGWAYFGVPPIFIGELVLLGGAVALLVAAYNWRVLNLSPVWCLLVLAVWGSVRTLPYVKSYGLDALRDAMIWGYAAFAIIVLGLLMSEPTRLPVLLERYRRFTHIFLFAAPAVWLATRLLPMPRWPGSGVAIVQMKGGDALVHFGGILAFWASGLGGRVSLGWVAVLVCSFGMIAVKDRAGLVSFMAAFALGLVLRPRNSASWRMVAILLGALLFAAVTDLRIELYDRNRAVSFNQIVRNVVSTFTDSGQAGLDGTKAWRLSWWGDILNYTVYGEHFWTGKGFGINLADDDGYQGTQWGGKLRSPHNGHMTVLARAGVPGLALWLLVHASWAVGMLHRHVQARVAGDDRWAGLFQFLLCYWFAFVVNASFDVFIEGPMGGIWLWTVYGVGLAAMWAYKYRPDALSYQPAPVVRRRLWRGR